MKTVNQSIFYTDVFWDGKLGNVSVFWNEWFWLKLLKLRIEFQYGLAILFEEFFEIFLKLILTKKTIELTF